MLDRRARLIVWAFLIGVIAIEGALSAMSFADEADPAAALIHFVLVPSAPPAAWSLAGIITLLYAAYAAVGSAVIRKHMLTPWTWGPYFAVRLVAVPMALISGFFEEAFFRKTLMDMAMHQGINMAGQIAISAGAFGAVHAIWGVASGNWRGAWHAMLATASLGAGLAFIYVLGGRAIGPCIFAHIAINLLIEPWLIITVTTNGWQRGMIKAPAGS